MTSTHISRLSLSRRTHHLVTTHIIEDSKQIYIYKPKLFCDWTPRMFVQKSKRKVNGNKTRAK